MHKDFIFAELLKQPRTPAAVRMVDRNYTAKKTDFMMIYLVHHLQQDIWTFAFWDGDLATEEHVRRAYRRLKDTFYLGAKLRFRPDSNYQEAVAKRAGDVPFILNDQIYKLADYQPLQQGQRRRHAPHRREGHPRGQADVLARRDRGAADDDLRHHAGRRHHLRGVHARRCPT